MKRLTSGSFFPFDPPAAYGVSLPNTCPRTAENDILELSHEEVQRIAELAKLELTDDEVALYARQLSSILQHFERLQAVDTSHIEPTASVLPLKNVLRPDKAGQPLSPQDVVANAPEAEDNQFRVPAVLDND